jgi:hypothetical protein
MRHLGQLRPVPTGPTTSKGGRAFLQHATEIKNITFLQNNSPLAFPEPTDLRPGRLMPERVDVTRFDAATFMPDSRECQFI